MPFGKYKDQEIGSVPASYLDWLAGLKWIGYYPEISNYVVENREHLDRELVADQEDRDNISESQW